MALFQNSLEPVETGTRAFTIRTAEKVYECFPQ